MTTRQKDKDLSGAKTKRSRVMLTASRGFFDSINARTSRLFQRDERELTS